MKRVLIQAKYENTLGAMLLEILYKEYIFIIVMLIKKDIYGNWIDRQICEDYQSIN